MNMIEKRKRNMGQGGFTLIELLVVIAILAILAGVAVFAVGNLTDGADENACKLEKDTLRTAVQASKAKNGSAASWQDYTDGTPKYWTVTVSAGPPEAVTYTKTAAGTKAGAGCA